MKQKKSSRIIRKTLADLIRKRTKLEEEEIIHALTIRQTIKQVIEKSKKKKTLEKIAEKTQKIKLKKRKHVSYNNGSYHPVSAGYVDYDKLFSYLGNMSSGNMYDGFEYNAQEQKQSNLPHFDFKEICETHSKHIKYFMSGDMSGGAGILPPNGSNINSKDWEKYRVLSMMSVYQPIITLMRSIV